MTTRPADNLGEIGVRPKGGDKANVIQHYNPPQNLRVSIIWWEMPKRGWHQTVKFGDPPKSSELTLDVIGTVSKRKKWFTVDYIELTGAVPVLQVIEARNLCTLVREELDRQLHPTRTKPIMVEVLDMEILRGSG